RIEPMSVRLGTGHQLPERREKLVGIVGAGSRLRVVLDAECRHVDAPQSLERSVVEVPVGEGDGAMARRIAVGRLQPGQRRRPQSWPGKPLWHSHFGAGTEGSSA